jgi:hypothetical protein
MSSNNSNNVFDPTSSASLTAIGLILAGSCSVLSSSYTFGKFQTQKERSEYQASMMSFVSGLVIVYIGYLIAFLYD